MASSMEGRLARGIVTAGLALSAEQAFSAERLKPPTAEQISAATTLSVEVGAYKNQMDRPYESELDRDTAQVKWWDTATTPTLDRNNPATGKAYDVPPATFLLEPAQDGVAKILPNTDSAQWLRTQLHGGLDGFTVDPKNPEALNEAANKVVAFDAVMDCYMLAAGEHSEAKPTLTSAQQELLSILETTYQGDVNQLKLAAQQYAEAAHFLAPSNSEGPQPNMIDAQANEAAIGRIIQLKILDNGQWSVLPQTEQWKWLEQATGESYDRTMADPAELRIILQDVVGADLVLGSLHQKELLKPTATSGDSFGDMFNLQQSAAGSSHNLEIAKHWAGRVGF